MNWDAVGAIAEVLGAVAVIASIIYLAIQVRQGTKLGQASAQREVNAAFNTIVYNWNSNAEVVRKAFLDFESLSKTDQLIASNCLAPFANHLDQVIRVHEQGYESGGKSGGKIYDRISPKRASTTSKIAYLSPPINSQNLSQKHYRGFNRSNKSEKAT